MKTEVKMSHVNKKLVLCGNSVRSLHYKLKELKKLNVLVLLLPLLICENKKQNFDEQSTNIATSQEKDGFYQNLYSFNKIDFKQLTFWKSQRGK